MDVFYSYFLVVFNSCHFYLKGFMFSELSRLVFSLKFNLSCTVFEKGIHRPSRNSLFPGMCFQTGGKIQEEQSGVDWMHRGETGGKVVNEEEKGCRTES